MLWRSTVNALYVGADNIIRKPSPLKTICLDSATGNHERQFTTTSNKLISQARKAYKKHFLLRLEFSFMLRALSCYIHTIQIRKQVI